MVQRGTNGTQALLVNWKSPSQVPFSSAVRSSIRFSHQMLVSVITPSAVQQSVLSWRGRARIVPRRNGLERKQVDRFAVAIALMGGLPWTFVRRIDVASSPSQFDNIRRNPLATLDIIAFVLPPFDPQNPKPSDFSFDYISLTATTTNFGVGVSKDPALPSF